MSERIVDFWFSFGNELSARWIVTLLHFVWQGTLVGCVVCVAAHALRGMSASVRYWLHATGLLALPACVAMTFCLVDVPESLLLPRDSEIVLEAEPSITNSEEFKYVDPQPMLAQPVLLAEQQTRLIPADPPNAFVQDESVSPDLTGRAAFENRSLALMAGGIAVAYALAVCGMLLRLGLALWGGQRLKTGATPLADPVLLGLFEDQASRIGLRMVPVVAYCERVAVPTVVGVLRPMVLLPASIVTGLSPQEFAAIISHELAHIRRYDLWMNLAQRVIESLLFFHPFVWYLSRQLSVERELCCDDLVVKESM